MGRTVHMNGTKQHNIHLFICFQVIWTLFINIIIETSIALYVLFYFWINIWIVAA